MPNTCYYEMKVRGTKKNCEEWYRKMQSDDDPDRFRRIFAAMIYDEWGTEEDYYMLISGDCAWSLDTCCRSSGYAGRDLFEINSRQLNVTMEAYSEEPGIGFQEHYIYKRGKCLASDCVDYGEWFYDKEYYENFEEFKEACKLSDSVTEDDLDEGGYYKEGGFTEWTFSI